MIHWTAIKRIIKYLIGTSTFGILFQKGEQHSLIGFSDADFAGDFETRKSTSGYVYKYSNAPITHRVFLSQQQKPNTLLHLKLVRKLFGSPNYSRILMKDVADLWSCIWTTRVP